MAEKSVEVFVNGTFDILHPGHLKLFQYAKSLGTTLHVAIDSDERVKSLKGKNRPINNEQERAEMLSALKYIDKVYIFDTDFTLENLIKQISPDIMIVGSDWKGKTVIGSQFAKTLLFFERIDGYSTTKKIQYIIDR